MPLKIIQNDITKVSADAIVNSANPFPICGGSTESCIYEAAGYDELLKAREKIGKMQVCEVSHTSAFSLCAKYIIHVVSPRWNEGESGEKFALRFCYERALQEALSLGCKSVAFPLLSSGVYKFPKKIALQIAKDSIEDFLKNENSLNVFLVLYDDNSIKASEKLSLAIQRYIDDNFESDEKSIKSVIFENENAVLGAPEIYQKCQKCTLEEAPVFRKLKNIESELEERLDAKSDTFQQRLYYYIQKKNLDDKTVYTRATLDRRHFAKIRKDVNYRPQKATVFALAVSLKLDLDETEDLLSRAGFAFSNSSYADLIVQFFIEHQIYDIGYINDEHIKRKEKALGAI